MPEEGSGAGRAESPRLPPGRGWAPLLVLPAAVVLLRPEPRWLFMWSLCAALFAGCKWLTWRRTPAPGAPWWRHAGYLLAWPGLDARAFLGGDGAPGAPARPRPREWAAGALHLALGAGLLWGVGRLMPPPRELVRAWSGMTGIVLLLHFGSFRLLSCGWRALGVDARPLMNRPLGAPSVSEFWGKRWNTAFRDVTHRFLFRPLQRALGPRWAIAAGFLWSGLVHELVVSVPAGGGYGGPTLFFALQGGALLAERSAPGRAAGLGRGWRGHLFTLLVLGLPLAALFHRPFVERVVLPFLAALGAGR